MRDRLAVETPEEREARLQRMSTNQHERLAVESPKKREARLQQMNINQRERLAVETPEETELRLEHYSTSRARRIFFLDEVRELSRQNDGKLMTGLHPFCIE